MVRYLLLILAVDVIHIFLINDVSLHQLLLIKISILLLANITHSEAAALKIASFVQMHTKGVADVAKDLETIEADHISSLNQTRAAV